MQAAFPLEGSLNLDHVVKELFITYLADATPRHQTLGRTAGFIHSCIKPSAEDVCENMF
jgi:hypothetical protein